MKDRTHIYYTTTKMFSISCMFYNVTFSIIFYSIILNIFWNLWSYTHFLKYTMSIGILNFGLRPQFNIITNDFKIIIQRLSKVYTRIQLYIFFCFFFFSSSNFQFQRSEESKRNYRNRKIHKMATSLREMQNRNHVLT